MLDRGGACHPHSTAFIRFQSAWMFLYRGENSAASERTIGGDLAYKHLIASGVRHEQPLLVRRQGYTGGTLEIARRGPQFPVRRDLVDQPRLRVRYVDAAIDGIDQITGHFEPAGERRNLAVFFGSRHATVLASQQTALVIERVPFCAIALL